MKILIVGEHSYIGRALEQYFSRYCADWEIDKISMRGTAWQKHELSVYDTIFFAAGKAHADVGNVTEEEKKEYYHVNRDLTIEMARRAKDAGVRQFIYPSSIIIYGESAPCGREKVITADTVPAPANFYGDSKLQADLAISQMADSSFYTAVLRLPMVYGANGKGNYGLLSKMAKKLPVFPNIKNQRSMLYIENLCQFVREIIENRDSGIFYPQNKEYVSTAEMVACIAQTAGKKIRVTPFLNPFVFLASKIPGKIGKLADKAFGNLVYDQKLSRYRSNTYQVYGLEDSVKRTEEP